MLHDGDGVGLQQGVGVDSVTPSVSVDDVEALDTKGISLHGHTDRVVDIDRVLQGEGVVLMGNDGVVLRHGDGACRRAADQGHDGDDRASIAGYCPKEQQP